MVIINNSDFLKNINEILSFFIIFYLKSLIKGLNEIGELVKYNKTIEHLGIA